MKTTLLFFFSLLLYLPLISFAQNNNQDSATLRAFSNAGTTVTPASTASQQKISHVTDSLVASDDVYNAYDEYVKRKVIKSPEFILSMMLLIFAVIICIAEIFVFLKRDLGADFILKLIILTLIIFAVLFLIVLGYTNDQIGPAFGLLGTIAGYLLGKTHKDSPSDEKKNNTNNNPPQNP